MHYIAPGQHSHTAIGTTRTSSIRVVIVALVVVDVLLLWAGLGVWTELVWLAVGFAGVIWVLNIVTPFVDGSTKNLPTRIALITRALSALCAPIVAAVVVATPITFQQGALFLALLLGSSAASGYFGKALELRSFLIGLSTAVALGAAAVALPQPPRTEPVPSFESDIQTDVTIKVLPSLPKGRAYAADHGVECAAILPSTWFEKRPLVYLGIGIMHPGEDGYTIQVPFSPLGYVVTYRDERLPRGIEIEIKGLLPKQSREVVVYVPVS